MDSSPEKIFSKENSNQEPKRGIAREVIFFFGLFLGVLITTIIFYVKLFNTPQIVQKTVYTGLSTESTIKVDERAENFEPIIAGNFTLIGDTNATPKILTISNDNTLRFHDFDTGATNILPVNASCCGGKSNTYVIGPLSSSDNKWLAYLDNSDNNIWIIDNEGGNKTKISSQGFIGGNEYLDSVAFLSGWSDDGRWLAYYVTLVDEDFREFEENKNKKLPPIIEGFYIADLKEGKVLYLPNLRNFVSFFPGSKQIVSESTSTQGLGTKLFIYDWNSGQESLLMVLPETALQLNFSSDGKHVLYVGGKISSSQTIYYSSTDLSETKEVASGIWAEVQRPRVSPNKKYIAYKRQTRDKCPGGGGCPQGHLVVYDIESGISRELGNIKGIIGWYDNNKILILGSGYLSPWSLEVYDKNSGLIKVLSTNEALYLSRY